MLDFNQDISALNVPNDCQLVIKGQYNQEKILEGQEKRQFEYLLSRKCLKECAQNLGYDFNFDPQKFDKKVPLHSDLAYSLSHSKQIAIALVVPKEKYLTCGIDIEFQDRQLTEKFINRITTPLERKLIDQYPERRLLLSTLIFSAKEAVFKAFSSKINNFSYQNIEIWEGTNGLKAIIINQEESIPVLSLTYAFYMQTHLVTCLIIPKY